ncbi:MAG TPA: 1,2-phenylacetyl-CoA epoxidase subunit PaaC [Streptosporangiaceae bacterium]|nr:1,2-phenylacetyl-CoA epoxidase subunit PaaC [Streptosporangiaceae bacterium]
MTVPDNTGHDNPYDLLSADDDDHRWAFGTGFTDPLAGVDTTVPDGVDAAALARHCLMLGDDALIYSHRLQQWITRLPELEEETAVANIALDLLGQARMLLARAAAADPSADFPAGTGEDRLAFFRAEAEFRNVRLAERADEDFAELAGRLLIFSAWRLALFERLRDTADPVLAAIAAKGVPELAYHRDYAARWVIRLGDGTELSHQRMQRALDVLWPLVDELFDDDLPVSDVRGEVEAVLDGVFEHAGVGRPSSAPLGAVSGLRGRDGVHTEAMGYVLAELQSVARAYPDATW